MRSPTRIRTSSLPFGKARDLLDAGRPSEAERLLRSRGCPRVFRAERFYLLGEAARLRGAFRESADRFRRCLASGPDADPGLWAEASLAMAGILRSLGLTGKAGAALEGAAKVFGRKGMGRALSERLELERALLLRAEGRYARSLDRLRSLLGSAGDARTRAYLLWAMAGALRFQGNLGAAETAFRRSLSLARGTGDRPGAGYALLGLGGVLRMRGRLGASLKAYSRAGSLFAGTEDRFAQAYAHCGIGNALRRRGRKRQALRRYLRSRSLYRSLGDEVDGAYVDWGIGSLLGGSGRLKAALRVFKVFGERRGEVLCLLGLSGIERDRGRKTQAARFEREAAAVAGRAGLVLEQERFA